MFCPKCGKADQLPETYCRQCGGFLPNYDKSVKKPIAPEEHIKANAVLSAMTIVASLILSTLLFLTFRNHPDTHPVIYVTAGFLIAISAWQVQTFWRTMLLRKHFKKTSRQADSTISTPELESKPTNQLLPEADFENIVPASVVEKTTRKLKVKS